MWAPEMTMSESDERRNPTVQRVELTTLVDICLQDGNLSPFQAESANVSGRGMQVRTSFLPEIGEQLVCRFEHESQEILVEGRVAWRSEGDDSGEFGIQFTALDAGSAEVLRRLGEANPEPPVRSAASRLFSLAEEEEAEDELSHLSAGERVRLHIDGLPAPMKACVQEGTPRKVKVGSSLEFLKLGRPLQIEPFAGGDARGAHVDSVNVVLNPSTAVPELVVMLRYEGVTPTPAPVAVEESHAGEEAPVQFSFGSTEPGPAEFEEEEEEALLPERLRPAADALRDRWEGVWETASSAAQKAGSVIGQVASSARGSLQKMRAPTGKTKRTRSLRRQAEPEVRRRTTTPPAHLRSHLTEVGVGAPRTRTQRSAQRAVPSANSPRLTKNRSAWLAGGALSLVVLSALALRSWGSGEELEPLEPNIPAAKIEPAAVSPGVPASAPPTSPEGIVADVPLFGPKAMATSETIQRGAPEMDDATAERLAAAAAVEDESFDEEPSAPAAPQDVAPWGRGKLHLPTIHRIRLDSPGAEIAGSVEPNGFTIVIPGRKAMETGRTIEKRDRRIAQVKASNTARGASVRFEFRGPVPAYRVRLRKDFIEFLISAPEEGVAKL